MVGGIGMVGGDAGLLKNVKNGPGGDIIPFFYCIFALQTNYNYGYENSC